MAAGCNFGGWPSPKRLRRSRRNPHKTGKILIQFIVIYHPTNTQIKRIHVKDNVAPTQTRTPTSAATPATTVLLVHLGAVEIVLCLVILITSATNGLPCVLHGFVIALLHPVALWTVTGLNCDRYIYIARTEIRVNSCRSRVDPYRHPASILR